VLFPTFATDFLNNAVARNELNSVDILIISSVSRLLLRALYGRQSNVSANVVFEQSALRQKYFLFAITISTFFPLIGKS
jgi:hypothetical protein